MDNVAKMPLVILVVSVFAFGSASVLKSSNILAEEIRSIEVAMGGSLYLHLCASFFLGGLCRLVTQKNLWLALPPTTLSVLALIMLDEGMQQLFPSRHFSWLDMLANIIGVLSGTYFVNAILKAWAFTQK
ncbi:VanZ family protein [Vibrio alfacsensis]|uniref:VanZ family protein n=1 Tax=Vibrio alfacsensis TaxID=1074311 RepID=UPI004067DBB8